jgi:hypothetical protein
VEAQEVVDHADLISGERAELQNFCPEAKRGSRATDALSVLQQSKSS